MESSGKNSRRQTVTEAAEIVGYELVTTQDSSHSSRGTIQDLRSHASLGPAHGRIAEESCSVDSEQAFYDKVKDFVERVVAESKKIVAQQSDDGQDD